MESKQQVTRPFCTSTCGGGWANLHSMSERLHLFLWNSRHTSSVSHLESFTLAMFWMFIIGLTMAIIFSKFTKHKKYQNCFFFNLSIYKSDLQLSCNESANSKSRSNSLPTIQRDGIAVFKEQCCLDLKVLVH